MRFLTAYSLGGDATTGTVRDQPMSGLNNSIGFNAPLGGVDYTLAVLPLKVEAMVLKRYFVPCFLGPCYQGSWGFMEHGWHAKRRVFVRVKERSRPFQPE